jgi:transcriptional regulator with XRE-family HTH domain
MKKKNGLLVNLGLRIKKIREEKGLTQVLLSYCCDMEKASISRIEAGKTNPSYLILLRLSRALGTSLSKLFGEDDLKFDSLYA